MDALLIIRLYHQLPEAAAREWAVVLAAAAEEFEIHSPAHQAMWLATLGHESRGLTALVENTNYDAKRLAQVWPHRFAVDPKAIDKQPNALAQQIGGYPERVANEVYSGRMGNGGPSTGRGWKYRGRYPAHLTGFDNYSACSADIGEPQLVTDPDAILQNLPAMSRVSAWFWWKNKCGSYDNFYAVSQVWNFGAPGRVDPIGWVDRQAWYRRATELMET